jgi:hypothetical protein
MEKVIVPAPHKLNVVLDEMFALIWVVKLNRLSSLESFDVLAAIVKA